MEPSPFRPPSTAGQDKAQGVLLLERGGTVGLDSADDSKLKVSFSSVLRIVGVGVTDSVVVV